MNVITTMCDSTTTISRPGMADLHTSMSKEQAEEFLIAQGVPKEYISHRAYPDCAGRGKKEKEKDTSAFKGNKKH